MIKENKVAWLEGMFLEPQHFQQHERYLEHLIQQKQVLINNHAWGFAELELELDLLGLSKVGIANARGIFPDGTPFNIPRNDKMPKPFEVPAGLNNTTLYLALPAKETNVAEIGAEEAEVPYRYAICDAEINDNVVGNDKVSQIQVAALACRIVSEHEDLSGYTCLPIARVLESRTNHAVTLDKSFVTTYLDVHATAHLANLVKEFHGLLNHRAVMLSGRLTDAQQAGTAEIVDFMLLQLINRYEPIFHYLLNKKPLHPEQFFMILIQLLGEMATFTNDRRRPNEPPIYQHASLFKSFQPVVNELRQALSIVLEQNATAIPLQERSHHVWVGQIHDKQLLENANFVLAVYSETPLDKIRTNFPLQVKIAPVEMIQTLVSRALPGIDISAIAVAPRQIPYHANFSYFALNHKNQLWQQMTKSAGIAIQVGGDYPGLKLELWAIKG